MQMLLNDDVKHLVSKYFSLGSKGYSDFVHLTEKNLSDLPDEFRFFNSEKELRKFVKIPKEMLKYIDEGYSVLKNLTSFCDKYNITFNDYYDNKKNVNKQDVKIFKLINTFYTNAYFETARHCGINPEFAIDYEMLSSIASKSRILEDFMECFRKYYKPSEREIFKRYLHDRDINLGKDIINEITTKIFEKIGSFKVKSNTDLYFVISKNPNDYFLSSYEKGWTSCLNPESSSGLWSCLPFIMADKGRCILYITDMSPKEYMNIKSFTMFKRSWGIIGSIDGVEKIYSQIFYPSKTIIDNDFFYQIGVSDKIENIRENFISKYPLDLFYNSYDIYDYLYQDNTNFIHGRDGRIHLKFGEHNHNILKYDDYSGLQILKIKWIEEGHTLSELISNNKELSDYADRHFCRKCHSYGSTFIVKYKNDYLNICNECFKELILSGEIRCESCGSMLPDTSDILKTTEGVVCRNCHSRRTKRTCTHSPNVSPVDFETLTGELISKIKRNSHISFSPLINEPCVPHLGEIHEDNHENENYEPYHDDDYYDNDEEIEG